MAQDDSTDKGRTARRAGSTELKRNALGAPSLVFIVIAAIAPLAACAANIPLIIGHGNGIAAPLDFVLMGVVLALFSCGYTAMSEHMVNAGAFWAYVSEGLGRVAGAAAGYLALVSYNVLTVCTSAMGGYIVSRNLGFELGSTCPGGRCPPCSGWSCGSSAPRGWTWARAFSGLPRPRARHHRRGGGCGRAR